MHKEWLHELDEELEYLKFKAPQPQGHAIYERLENTGLRQVVLAARAAVNAIPGPKPATLQAAMAASLKREAEKRAEAVTKTKPQPQNPIRSMFNTKGWL
jgi:hypothetical protein